MHTRWVLRIKLVLSIQKLNTEQKSIHAWISVFNTCVMFIFYLLSVRGSGGSLVFNSTQSKMLYKNNSTDA